MAEQQTKGADIYHIVFEEYLQPKQPYKANKLILFNNVQKSDKKPPLRLKLLEHPAIKAQHIDSKSIKSQTENNKNEFFETSLRIKSINLKNQLKKFFHFLLPPQDDGLCRRKTGFEIYCEMASVHGFINFVNAKAWQRVFWTVIIGFAICMIITIATLSWTMNNENPTIFYTEGITLPSWTVSFPAVTICNLNKMSKHRVEKIADKFLPNSTLSRDEMLRLFRFAYYSHQETNATANDIFVLNQLLKQNNYTIEKLIHEVTPKCGSNEYKLCKWRSHHERCQNMVEQIVTSNGICCAFNYWATKRNTSGDGPELVTSCNYQTGFSVLLNPDVDDYWLSFQKIAGYQVFIHDSYDLPHKQVEAFTVPVKTETTIAVSPRATYGTTYLRSKPLTMRYCYFPEERILKNFTFYSQANCAAECRSKLIHGYCGCVPVLWPVLSTNWRVCQTYSELKCILKYKENSTQMIKGNEPTNRERYFTKNFICDCFPLCNYNKYDSQMESGPLDHEYSVPNRRLFKGIKRIKNHILLHVFYADLIAEKYRLDVTENWLSFMGNFGGIAGLYIGYSFVSTFEMIFFAFVRPACNWLTKQQIRYRTKQKNKAVITKNVKQQQEVVAGVD